jgi:hypothetical protein
MLCVALAAGAALAAPPVNNNPPPTNNPAGNAAPVLTAPNAPPPPSVNLPRSFPTSAPASKALSDPVARQLNLALGLAGALRKEMSEGRGGGERASELLELLHKTMIGLRDNSVVRDRKPDDEVWARPQSEALAAIEEVRRLRAQALDRQLPDTSLHLKALQEATARTSRMFDKLTEASRKRHEQSVSSIRNIK